MKSLRSIVLLVAVLSAGIAGCAQEAGEVCETHPDGTTDCAAGLICCGSSGGRGICQDTCTSTDIDAGAPRDGGADAGTDAGAVDAGETDAGPEGTDAGHDAGTDAGVDAGHDAGTDAGADAGP